MKEIMKGKRNLASRIIAVLLSLVMVLSVLYVSNKDKEVSAEEPAAMECDAPTIAVDGTSTAETETKNITITFYGAVNVTFGLGNIKSENGVVTYKYDGIYYSADNSSDMDKISLDADSAKAVIDIYVTEAAITTEDTGVKPVVTLELQYADSQTLKNALAKATTEYNTVTRQLNIQTGLNAIKAGETISSDTEITEYVYGELLYGTAAENNGAVSNWQSGSAVTINETGKYYPYLQLKLNGTEIVETQVGTGPVLCDSEPPKVTNLSLKQGADAKGTVNSTTVSDAYITDTYTVSFTSDEDGTVSLTKDGKATDVKDQNVQANQSVTVTIPEAASADAGKTISYKLEVKDISGNAAQSVITITYLSGNTTISDVKVNDKSVSASEKVIAKKNSDGNVVISANIFASIDLKSVKLLKKEGGGNDYKDASASQTLQNNQYSFTLNSPADASNDYRIEVENAYGEKQDFDFTLVIDNTAPELSSFTLKTTADGEDETVEPDNMLIQKLSLHKNKDAKVTLPFTDATNISSLKVYAKIGSLTSTEQVIDLNAQTTRTSSLSPEIPLSKFHVGLSDDQIKGSEVKYYAVVQDEAENSKEYLLFTAMYYKDELAVTEVLIGNFRLNPVAGAQAAAEAVVKSFTHDGKTGTLTNAVSYDVSFKVTSDIELQESDITLFAGETALEQKPSTFTEAEADGTFTYTGSFVLNEKYEGNTVTYKVQAKNPNDVTAEKEATILFIDITAPAVTEVTDSDLKYDEKNETDKTMWYRNLTVVYSASDSETDESIASGIEKLEVSQDNSAYATVEEQNGKYLVTVQPSANKTGTDIRLRVTDNAGNIYYYPSEEEYDTYHVDNAKPVVSLSVQDEKGNVLTNGGRLSGIPQIVYSMTDDLYLKGDITVSYPNGSTVAFSTAEDPWTEKSVKGTLSLKTILESAEQKMSDGTYTITLNAEDTIGKIEPITFSFTIDNKPPEVTKIYVKENNAGGFTEYTLQTFQQYLKRSVCPEKLVIRIGAEDALGDVSNITVSQYGGAAQSFLGNTTGDIEITPSRDGNGTPVHVEVFDANENSNNKNSYDWNILVDSQVPTLNLAVQDSAYKDNDSVLKGDPVIAMSDSDNIRITARDIEIQTPTSTIRRSDSSHLGTNKLSALLGRKAVDGKYVIKLSATDPAGHRVEKMLSFTLDNTIPVNEMKIANAAPAKMNKYNRTSYDGTKYGQYYNANVTFNYSATDANIKNVTVWDNGNAVSSRPNGTVIISQEGSHTISITSEDMAGNQGTLRSFTFVIDKTAPVISTTLNGSTYTNNSGIRYLRGNGTLTISVNELNKDTDDLTRVERITPPSQSTQTNSAKIGEGTAVYQTEADYEVSFVVVDRAGNVSAERTVQFRVDKNAPELTISGIADGGTSTKSVTVTYGIQEAFYWDMTSAKVNIYKGIDGQREKLLKTVDYNAKNANSRMSETFSEDGDYRFEFTAEDKAGNTAQKSYSFILDGTAPVISLSGVKNYDKTKDKVTMEVTVTEDFFTSNELTLKGTLTDGAGKKQNLKFGAFSVNSSRVSNIIQQFTEDGVYDLEVTSKDKAGNTTTETLHFTIDNSAPALTDLSAYDGTVMNEFVWNLSNDDVVNDLTVCDVVVYLDGTEYDGLNDVEDGKHVLRIVATDELGNTVEKQYEFLLDTIAPNVIITGAEDGGRLLESTDVGVSLQIDGDILDSVTLNGENKAITDNACNFTVDRSGEYELLVKAHDGAGNTVEKMIHFEYGKKFNILWIILLILLLLLLAVVIILLVRKSKKDRA